MGQNPRARERQSATPLLVLSTYLRRLCAPLLFLTIGPFFRTRKRSLDESCRYLLHKWQRISLTSGQLVVY